MTLEQTLKQAKRVLTSLVRGNDLGKLEYFESLTIPPIQRSYTLQQKTCINLLREIVLACQILPEKAEQKVMRATIPFIKEIIESDGNQTDRKTDAFALYDQYDNLIKASNNPGMIRTTYRLILANILEKYEKNI